MAFFADEDRKFVIYESPKTGGTTLRSWINYAGTGEIMLSGTKDYYYESNNVYSSLDSWGYDYSKFREFDGYERVCIKRDPISRFISCYTDKVVRENHIPNCDMDNFIRNMEQVLEEHPFMHPSFKGEKVGFLWYHFVPQAYHLGESKEYYDLVVDTKDISTVLKPYLESKWEVSLPDLHTRKQTVAKPTLTDEQCDIIRKYYQIDYSTGWL